MDFMTKPVGISVGVDYRTMSKIINNGSALLTSLSKGTLFMFT